MEMFWYRGKVCRVACRVRWSVSGVVSLRRQKSQPLQQVDAEEKDLLSRQRFAHAEPLAQPERDDPLAGHEPCLRAVKEPGVIFLVKDMTQDRGVNNVKIKPFHNGHDNG